MSITAVDNLAVYQDAAQEWRWTLTDAAGEVVAASNDGFATEHDAYVQAQLAQSTFANVTITEPVPPWRKGLCAPTSYWNLALPDVQTLDPLSATVVGEIVAQSKATFTPPGSTTPQPIYPNFNTTAYSSTITIVDASTPRKPVRITKPAPWNKAFADICIQGVPIPDNVVLPLPAPQDTDSEMVFWDQGADQYWEFWHFRVNSDPVTLANGVPYEAQWGGRMSLASTNPGHFLDRFTTWKDRTSPNLPTDPVKASQFEQKEFGATATSIPLAPGILTAEDVTNGHVAHAIGMSLLKTRAKTWRWPAQRCDGNDTTVNVCEGMRLRFPAGMSVPAGLHPIAGLFFQAIRDYGCVIWDKAGAVGFRAEPAVQGMLGGTPKYKVLFGFPWDQLQLLVEGSDVVANP